MGTVLDTCLEWALHYLISLGKNTHTHIYIYICIEREREHQLYSCFGANVDQYLSSESVEAIGLEDPPAACPISFETASNSSVEVLLSRHNHIRIHQLWSCCFDARVTGVFDHRGHWLLVDRGCDNQAGTFDLRRICSIKFIQISAQASWRFQHGVGIQQKYTAFKGRGK